MEMVLMSGAHGWSNERSLEPFDPRVIAMMGKHGGWFSAE
jgi:hypothetical protein